MSEKDFERVMTNAFTEQLAILLTRFSRNVGLKKEWKARLKKLSMGYHLTMFFEMKMGGESIKVRLKFCLIKSWKTKKGILKDRVTETFDAAYRGYTANQDLAQILSDHVYEIFSIKRPTSRQALVSQKRKIFT